MTNTEYPGKVKPTFNKHLFDWYLENDFKLVSLRGKRPSGSGPRRNTYIKKSSSIKTIMKGPGLNVGAEIPTGFLVLDVDPRNGGDEAARAMVEDLFENSTFLDLLTSTFTVRTGGGGWHLYFTHGKGEKLVGSLKQYGPGIDIKKAPGGYVVAPGSVHPDTGEHYTILENGYELDPQPLPAEIRDLLVKEIRNPLEQPFHKPGNAPHPLWGLTSPAELGTLLDALDPRDFRDYVARWFPLLCAAHHATGGDPEASVVFAEWSAKDPAYCNEAHRAVERKWNTARERRGKADSELATIRSILAHVKESVEVAELLGDVDPNVPPSAEVSRALGLRREVIERITASELETIASVEGGDSEAAQIIDWVETLAPGWEREDPSAFPKLLDKICRLDDTLWPLIADTLAPRCAGQLTSAKIQKLIKRQRAKRDKEDPPLNMTHARIVDIAATRAMKAIAKDPKNLVFPPNGQPYLYRDGCWSKEHPASISKVCYSQLKAFVDLNLTGTRPVPSYARDTFQAITLERTVDSTDLYARSELPSCVNLANGTLWISKNGATDLRPHRRDDLLTTKLPYPYDPEATCPAFDKMLEQVFAHVEAEFGLAERSDLIRHFWELIGYAIQPKKDLPKILIWTGEGKNGKTRISKIISKLVGKDAWLSASIAQFFDPRQPHNTTSAEGKLLLVDDDVKINATLRDGDLKRFSKEDDLQVNPKGRDHYTIHVQLIPLIITNNKMHLLDTSYGFTRRLDVIEWNTNLSHLEGSPLPDLVEAEQMPGVLNRAIEGLARLRKRGTFDLPHCVDVYNARFVARSNNVIGFWESLAKTADRNAKHSTRDLYEAYRYRMRLEDYERPSSLPGFIDTIRRHGVDINADFFAGWSIKSIC